jgi:hypothetical protein
MRFPKPASCLLFLLLLLQFPTLPAFAQRDRRPDPADVSSRFFQQLRSMFGRFRDGDLDQAFEAAKPIQCSELVSGDGEWHPVAFFNEDRKLGDWYHGSLEEAKGDLSKYAFSGTCSNEQGAVSLVSTVPVEDSLDRYLDNRIRFEQVKIQTQPAVRASFDAQFGVYGFDLPYLYVDRKKSRGRQLVYTPLPQTEGERAVPDLINHWDCKSVRASDVTFHFLICQTWTYSRGDSGRRPRRGGVGNSAYFILSDGKEASSTTRLSFNLGDDAPAAIAVPAPGPDKPLVVDAPSGGWQVPKASTRLRELESAEFRLLFSSQTWTGKIGADQILIDQKISTLDSTKIPVGGDYCTWRPVSSTLVSRVMSKEPNEDVDYALMLGSSAIFDLKTFTGTRLGRVQCFFPKAPSALEVTFEQWVAVVGGNLTLEVR